MGWIHDWSSVGLLWGNHEGEAWGTTGGDSQAEEGADDLRKGWAREGGECDDRGDS